MNETELNRILETLPAKSVAVVGDFCVDRYLDIDPGIEDCSKETGLPIHQVICVRSYPGGSGTVLNNLHALGVGEILPVGFLGRDGEGYELRQALTEMGISFDYLQESASRRTPAYTKPLLVEKGRLREISRFDIFPRTPLSDAEERLIVDCLDAVVQRADAVIISDYTEAGKSGVVTAKVREKLMDLAVRHPGKPMFADSRLFIDKFHGVCIKPNEREVCHLLGIRDSSRLSVEELMKAGRSFARTSGRTVYVTLGARGILVCRDTRCTHWPGYPVTGQIDVVGAGDAVLASVTGALAAGATEEDAGMLGVLVSSITIQQIGTTGVARPDEVRVRFREYAEKFPEVVNS